MTNEEAKEIIECSEMIDAMSERANEALDIAIEALEHTRWIPVSERLPEENGYYLTTTMYHEVYCDYWEEDRFNRTETVIAWMPLPKPYKAESEE